MEAEQSQPTGGERSGGPEQSVSEPPLQGSLPQSPSPQHHRLFPSRSLQTPGRHPLHRQHKRGDLEHHYPRLQQQPPSAFQLPGSADPERVTGTTAWQFSDSPGPSGGAIPSSSSSSTSRLHQQLVPPPRAGKEAQEGVPRRERKPQKPGKYVCQYCGRPCAKPSVLQKHIRSHTGERPYPCTPCGFSFKTKSNLYKHRKSHAHRIKAGLASGREGYTPGGPEGGQPGVEQEEQTEGESTDSEDETGQHTSSPSSSFSQDPYGGLAPRKSASAEQPEDSHAVKQRLAMRLSERKRAPVAVPDDPASSFLSPGSKGSTESGYFSRSESAEQQQGSPPSADTKSYAEIILGKYGRMGQQQRNVPPQQQQQHHPPSSSTQEEKGVPFSVPKTQVIEHITKLITINEAVVDTSEIDSVKPRRTSLSRRGSLESPKAVGQKDPFLFDPKGEFPSTSSSIGCMGVGVVGESLYPQVPDPAFLAGLSSTVPLLRSHSMPSSADPSAAAGSSHSFRLSHSFDERQALATETRAGTLLPPHHRMLRRQPAIEVPLGSEFIPEKPSSSCSSTYIADPAQKHRRGPQLYKCEACGAHYKKQDNYETHRRYYCPVRPPQAPEREPLPSANREDRPQMMHHMLGASAAAVRKRRKEKSLGDEEEPPAFEPSPASVTSSSSYSTSPYSASAGIPSRPLEESRQAADILGRESSLGAPVQSEQDRRTIGKISVIQHTSSFEKQETASGESQESNEKGRGSTALEQHQQPKPPTFSRLVRQSNIQVPEILVTEEPDPDVVLATPSASVSKELEKTEEFQWPQRSQSLSQLPAEKLPPKKKRLRLTEAAHSSGESSFESISLPRSPSQESNVSHASSRSVSFEETGKPQSESQLTATRASHVTHMLTVPSGSHQHNQPHREMRRSASEQAPTSAQHPAQIAEARSKSFDYGSLSPQCSSTAWRERRKCLLVRQATLGEPEPEEQPAGRSIKAMPQVCLGYHSPAPPATQPGPAYHSTILSTDPLTKSLQLFPPPPSCEHAYPLQSLLPPPPPTSLSQGQAPQLFPAPGISEVLSTQVLPHSFLQASSQVHPAQLHPGEHLGLPLQYRSVLPLQYPAGAAPALFVPVPPGLGLQPTREPFRESKPVTSSDPQAPSLLQPPRPVISSSAEQLRPVVSLVMPIRLQSHVPTYGHAIYTTLSQVLVTRAQESAHSTVVICKVEEDRPRMPYLKIPTTELKMYHPLTVPLETGVGMATGEGHWPSTAGGNKRMLSPAGSLELSVEAQRQQKRVKEEEDEEKGGKEEEEREEKVKAMQREEEEKKDKAEEVGKVKEIPLEKPEPSLKEEKGEESQREPSQARGPDSKKDPPYPSLHTTTTVSWCYLNYVKPTPGPQRDPHSSVYSSWSISLHNPNLPGLPTRAALSLLCSKQKHSPETYTMATGLHPAAGKLVSANSRKPKMSEVHLTPTHSVEEKEEEKREKKEQEASTSKRAEPSRIPIFEGGYKSNEEYVYVRGRGRGKYVCEECGIRCKKPSMLKKHIRTHTDVRPYICKHCNFAFKTKGNLTKHMKSKAHGKKCQEMGMSGSSLDELEAEEGGPGGSEEQDDHQFSDVDDSEDSEENEDEEEEEEEEEEESHEDPPSSISPDNRHSSPREREPPAGPPEYLSPRRHWPSDREASPGSKRALFSRRHLEASPLRCLSPGREDLSSPSRHLSPGPETGPSPFRPRSPGKLSPRRLHSSIATETAALWYERAHCSSSFTVQPSTEWKPVQREDCTPFPPAPRPSHSSGESPGQHIFSHLPLHSQQLARTPYLMIPIGGIQMVQPRPNLGGLEWVGQPRRKSPSPGGARERGSLTPEEYRVHKPDSGTSLSSQAPLEPPSLSGGGGLGGEAQEKGTKQYGSSRTYPQTSTLVSESHAVTPDRSSLSEPSPSQLARHPTHRRRNLSGEPALQAGRQRRRVPDVAGSSTSSAVQDEDDKTGSTSQSPPD